MLEDIEHSSRKSALSLVLLRLPFHGEAGLGLTDVAGLRRHCGQPAIFAANGEELMRQMNEMNLLLRKEISLPAQVC
ncbi:MAG: hypothetical protein HZA54_05880 [Planctomycetes bacterium]|nr:hypothetical protein [Planctomycetota bacterium]